jgi:hypothetical protein
MRYRCMVFRVSEIVFSHIHGVPPSVLMICSTVLHVGQSRSILRLEDHTVPIIFGFMRIMASFRVCQVAWIKPSWVGEPETSPP